MNEREARYSQPKLELFGLYRALRHFRLYIVGVQNLIVEVDAKYIKEMLNRPDLQPNAVINRWIGGILTYTFKLVHIPAKNFKGTDGLSRRRRADDDTDPEESDEDDEENDDEDGTEDQESDIDKNIKDWVSEASYLIRRSGQDFTHLETFNYSAGCQAQVFTSRLSYDFLHQIFQFLSTLQLPTFSSNSLQKRFIKQTKNFFVQDDKLWKRHATNPRLVILDSNRRKNILRLAHDNLGHRGVYGTAKTISQRFWWPSYYKDVEQYVKTCHECQIRVTNKLHIPITISAPTTLFTKVYLDIMLMPKAQGYRYIIAARDDLSGAAEGRKLKRATARTVSQFIFEELLCRYGAIAEIVTDNGPEVKGATEELLRRHGIPHIHISPYNSQANGVVERGHFTIREGLVKACEGNINRWPDFVHHAFFADRVTTRRATGFSPFYLLHGVDPVLPLDLLEVTYLVPRFVPNMSSSDLLTL